MTTTPIFFTTDMVRAILMGLKTQTRRPLDFRHGDVLWVRETWAKSPYGLYYHKAGWNGCELKWKPSIHMPREACRLYLKVLDSREEHIMDITESDALAEGIGIYEDTDLKTKHGITKYRVPMGDNVSMNTDSAVSAFGALWDSLYGVGQFEQNQMIHVITFEIYNP